MKSNNSGLTLYLFTANFPYAPGEDFLKSEIFTLARNFERCYIFPTNYIKTGTESTELPENVEVVVTNRPSSSLSYKILKTIQQLVLDPKLLFSSIRSSSLNSKKKYSISAFAQELKYLSKVKEISKTIQKQIIETKPRVTHSLFYSCWLHTPASVALQIKQNLNLQNLSVVSRAHGFDIYESRQPSNYLPQRLELLRGLDEISFVSLAGLKHLSKKYPEFSEKFSHFRLGAQETKSGTKNDFNYSIVSCSYLQEVKRVELIPEVLKLLSERGLRLKWTHIGGGSREQEQQLLLKVHKLIPEIEFTLTGNLDNQSSKGMLRFDKFDLFLNVSSSEGVPLSGMEALSGGLPLVMTDVGGSRELIEIKDGMYQGLISANPQIYEIAEKIENFYNEPFSKVLNYSQSSLAVWKKNWNSERNYELFTKHLIREHKIGIQ